MVAMHCLCSIGGLQLGLLLSGTFLSLCMLWDATMLTYCLLCAKQDTPPALHSAQLPLTFDEWACLLELAAMHSSLYFLAVLCWAEPHPYGAPTSVYSESMAALCYAAPLQGFYC